MSEMKRANYMGAPAAFKLNQACRIVTEAFGFHLYLVGSVLQRRDFRDVDLRLILDDDDFDQMFPDSMGARENNYDAKWSLICTAISEYLASASGLPVDFQIQRSTQANEKYGTREHPRHAFGIFVHRAREIAPEPAP